jgi:hypothetical protein
VADERGSTNVLGTGCSDMLGVVLSYEDEITLNSMEDSK